MMTVNILIMTDDHSSEEKEVDICLLNGKEYIKGQAIPTGDPCKTCTCVEGFTGTRHEIYFARVGLMAT